MERLDGKVAVVTGAGAGIGRGIALALGDAGCDVVVADIDQQRAEAVVRELGGSGRRSLEVHCDVTERASVTELADRAWSEFGHVDIVVNNAGVSVSGVPLLAGDERNFRWMFEVNVLGVWNGCSIFGDRLVAQGTPAHIVNTGSEFSIGIPIPGSGFYAATKHAVLGLSDVLRRELPEYIGVSILCPGGVRTALSQSIRGRPERFGGPADPSLPFDPSTIDFEIVLMEPEEVGRRTVAGIERGDFYIVTHPPTRAFAAERWEEIAAAHDAQAPRFDGDHIFDTRDIVRRAAGGETTKSGVTQRHD